MRIFLLVFQMIIMFAMVGVILLQQGEDAASSFASTRKGTSGLVKLTSFLGFVFFVNCLILAQVINRESTSEIKTVSGLSKKEPLTEKEPLKDQSNKVETKVENKK